MNIKPANAVNQIARRLIPHAALLGEDARDDLLDLIGPAYKKLMAGYSPEKLRAEWDAVASRPAPGAGDLDLDFIRERDAEGDKEYGDADRHSLLVAFDRLARENADLRQQLNAGNTGS